MEKKAILEIFAANLRTSRKTLKLTQAQMAKLIGVSTSFITEIETGRKAPSFQTIEKIADVTNTPVWAFFNDSFSSNLEFAADDIERMRIKLKDSACRCIDEIFDEMDRK